MMDFDDHGMSGTGWLVSGLVSLLLLGILVVVLAAVLRGGWSDSRQQAPQNPLRLLDERFARGELDEPEYLRRRDLLTGSAGHVRPPSS